jgi:hypothetical protein
MAIADGPEYTSNPLTASVRVEFHAQALKTSMHTLQRLCGVLRAAIQSRISTLQQCVQVAVSVSKAALATQAQMKEPAPLHVDNADYAVTAGDGVRGGMTRANSLVDDDTQLPYDVWLTEVSAEVLGTPLE